MTKKSNRPKAKAAPKPAVTEAPITSEPEMPATPPPAREPRVPRAPKLTRSQIAAERIEDEYAYITDDLRRVFILAGLIFALLIALNLVFQAIG